MRKQLSLFDSVKREEVKSKVVNVASIPQRSPFRFPGGKTWLIPIVRNWLKQDKYIKELCEPFAGGGIVSLTVAFENLAEKITMVEIDDEIAAVWEVIINGNYKWLADKIYNFDLSPENVNREFNKTNKTIEDIAFCTILKNRVFHGGIITKGSGLIKKGENGKGIKSRWYPKTLRDRISSIEYVKHKIEFKTDDAFRISDQKKDKRNIYFFVDPPYTKAGKRLYTHFDINHDSLFALVSQLNGRFMITYDDCDEIRDLAKKYSLDYRTIPMKTTHHIEKREIIISDNFNWWK